MESLLAALVSEAAKHQIKAMMFIYIVRLRFMNDAYCNLQRYEKKAQSYGNPFYLTQIKYYT